jgi:hypothetical protein
MAHIALDSRFADPSRDTIGPMRTFCSATNHILRRALDDADDDAIGLLLASTLGLAHDGTLDVDDDGRLPKGRPLALGIARGVDGTWLLGAYTDMLAVSDPSAPTAGIETPVAPITGDDLIMLAAANHVGIHINPGCDEQLALGAQRVSELAVDVRARRAGASVRVFDEHTLVTLRAIELQLDDDHDELLQRELAARGASLAFVAEYALHDRSVEPDTFTQLIVVGDDDGHADYALREDARRLLEYLTGTSTDSAAYDAMPQVHHIAEPLLQPDGALPQPLTGVV